MKKWFVRNFSNSFKKFKKEFLSVPPEQFFRDGERQFSQKEKFYLKILWGH